MRCDICNGTQKVRLPRYRQVLLSEALENVVCIPADEMYREYPCPECNKAASVDRVMPISAHVMVDVGVPDEFIYSVHQGAALKLADELLRGGFITFDTGEKTDLRMRYPVVATVHAVHPKQAQSIEDRICQRQGEVAHAAAEEAIKQIGNWGSYYGTREIEKDHAFEFIREAAKTVIARWSRIESLKVQRKIADEA